ncbi:MAG: DUF4168 domain-containing protein [Desulfatiglandaceae bacterium]
MIKKTSLAITVGSVALLFLLALPGFAQQQQQRQQQPPPQQQQQAPSVSEEDLNKAANAHVKITRIREDYQQSLQQAGDDKQKMQELQTKANDNMIKAVEGEGLDAQRYNEILQAVRSDKALNQKFMNKVKKAQ